MDETSIRSATPLRRCSPGATKHAIPYLIVIGENEQASKSFTIKDLKTGEEQSVTRDELPNFFNA
jgi:histidyl-tRNA synthetase